MNKFELLKMPEHFRDIDHYLELIASVNKYRHLSEGEILSDDINSSTMLFLTFYLLDKLDDARTYAKLAASKSIRYFDGEWRNIPYDNRTKDPAKWNRIERGWIEKFLYGTMCALFMGDYESARRIAAYPGEDCKSRMLSYTVEDWACYLLLAALIRGEKLDNNALLEKINSGKKKKPKLILPVLQAIQAKDSEKFNLSLAAYLKYFCKTEFGKDFDHYQSIEATILFYCGKMFALDIVDEFNHNIYLIV